MYRPVDAGENYRSHRGTVRQGLFRVLRSAGFHRHPRCRKAKSVAVVRAYMAHHQGMSLVALDNVLHDRIMQTRFHAEPGITAADLHAAGTRIRFVEAPALVETDIPAPPGMDDVA